MHPILSFKGQGSSLPAPGGWLGTRQHRSSMELLPCAQERGDHQDKGCVGQRAASLLSVHDCCVRALLAYAAMGCSRVPIGTDASHLNPLLFLDFCPGYFFLQGRRRMSRLNLAAVPCWSWSLVLSFCKTYFNWKLPGFLSCFVHLWFYLCIWNYKVEKII